MVAVVHEVAGAASLLCAHWASLVRSQRKRTSRHPAVAESTLDYWAGWYISILSLERLPVPGVRVQIQSVVEEPSDMPL